MASEILMLAVGLGIGGVCIWVILKSKIQAASDKARAEAEAERASLGATLQARDNQIQGLGAAMEKTTVENIRLQSELTTESARRAAADEKGTRVPTLEAEVKEKAAEITRLSAEVTTLKEAQASPPPSRTLCCICAARPGLRGRSALGDASSAFRVAIPTST